MWRWSSVMLRIFQWLSVFSTYVEVIPASPPNTPITMRILHVCGGDPSEARFCNTAILYSPRMWRWSYDGVRGALQIAVFSTYVEVILYPKIQFLARLRILHVCGGDPFPANYYFFLFMYSPRMWRWSCSQLRIADRALVFSTYVEVILKNHSYIVTAESILHVCGGDPVRNCELLIGLLYSPRMWRWSCTWSLRL